MCGRGFAGTDECLIYTLRTQGWSKVAVIAVERIAPNLENRVYDGFVARADELSNCEDSSNSNPVPRCRPGF